MKKNKSSFFQKRWLQLTIVWALLLTASSQLPGSSFPKYSIFNYDKLLHLFAYIPLGYFFAQSIQQKWSVRFVITMLFVAVFGAMDEVHQSFVPGRFASIYDFYADLIGGGIGVLLVRIWMSGNFAPSTKPSQPKRK